MDDTKELLQRARRQFPPPERVMESLLRRRERKQRNKRIGTVAVALIVAAAAFGVTSKAFFGGPAIPADLPSTPESWSFTRLPQAQFNCCDNGMHSVVAGGPGLVAVGSSDGRRHRDGYFLDGPASVWTSPDGTSWTHITGDELGDGVIEDVTTGGPGLVAVGSYGATTDRAHNGIGQDFRDAVVWASKDGSIWTRGPNDPDVFADATMTAVAFGAPGFVAVGWSGVMPYPAAWFSSDAVSWTRASVDGIGAMADVTAFGDGFVAVGNGTSDVPSGTSIWTSEDGLTWTRVADDPAFADVTLTGVTDGPNGLVAFGGSAPNNGAAAALTSQDGVHWTRVDPRTPAFIPPSPANDRYWVLLPASVTSTGDGYVAVGRALRCPTDPSLFACGVIEATVWISPDGQSWTRVPSAPVFQQANEERRDGSWLESRGMVNVVAWGSRYAAVGNLGTVWVSS